MITIVRRIFLFIAIFTVSGKLIHGQEMLGYLNNMYSGFSSAQVNPSATVSSPFYLDIIAFTVHAFAENNYIYLARREYRFSRFLERNPSFPVHGADNEATYDRYTRSNKNG